MEELFPALPFPEKLMLLLKHLQKEREIHTANKRIKCTLPPTPGRHHPKQLGATGAHPPRIRHCVLWEGFNPLLTHCSGQGRCHPFRS